MTNDDTTRTPGEQYGGSAPDLEHMQRLVGTRYRLQWIIGHGGMSTVWLATDATNPDGAPVAIKILKPEYSANAEFRERFHNEATAAALITNPHVVKTHAYKEVIDAGRTSCFIVMEYVRGESLADVLARAHRLPEDQALTILSQASDGLAAIHNAGMIHRDIKPGNVLITSDGTVKIADFGIAKAAEAVPLTRTGMVVGTAQYVSPEQAQGLKSTPATDIYSLGIVGYEMLTGQRPFQGDTSVAIALAHINNTPPALPDAISRPTRELIATMLRKDPAARYATGSALSRAIASVQAGFPPPPPQAPANADPTAETSVFPGVRDAETRVFSAANDAGAGIAGAAAGAAAGSIAGAAAGSALEDTAATQVAGQGYGPGGATGDGTAGFAATGAGAGAGGYGAGAGAGGQAPAGQSTTPARASQATSASTSHRRSAARQKKATTWLLALGVILLVVILAVALWLAWGVNRTGSRDNTGQVATSTTQTTTSAETTTSAPAAPSHEETTSDRPVPTTAQPTRSASPTTTATSTNGSRNGNNGNGSGSSNSNSNSGNASGPTGSNGNSGNSNSGGSNGNSGSSNGSGQSGSGNAGNANSQG